MLCQKDYYYCIDKVVTSFHLKWPVTSSPKVIHKRQANLDKYYSQRPSNELEQTSNQSFRFDSLLLIIHEIWATKRIKTFYTSNHGYCGQVTNKTNPSSPCSNLNRAISLLAHREIIKYVGRQLLFIDDLLLSPDESKSSHDPA